MNITAFILFLAGCCLLSAGCNRQAAIPSDSFRLSVERVFMDRDYEISRLKIHTLHDAYISISNQFSHGTVNMAHSPADTAGDGEVALVAARCTRPSEKSSSIQTLIRCQSLGASTASPGYFPASADTSLETYLSVSLTNGDFKLDTPIEICRLDGKPVMMVVGKPTQ